MASGFVTRCAVRELGAADWPAWLERLRVTEGFWLLESSLPGARLGRFSCAGAAPYAVARIAAGRLTLESRRAVRPDLDRIGGRPLEALGALLPPPCPAPELETPPFVGGAVGWLGYELGAALDGVAPAPIDDLGLPDAALLCVDRTLSYEHASGTLRATALGFGADAASASAKAGRHVDRLAERVLRGHPDPFDAGSASPPASHTRAAVEPFRWADPETGLVLGAFFDEAAYVKSVLQLKEHIAAGDVYQANLTHRMALDDPGDAWAIYRALRRCNPAPFAAFLSLPEITLIGSSPERFLRLDPDGRVEARPIKGTRPRGATRSEDESLRAALESSAKDRAENVMIVDLMRNDLGRVSRIGSVAVPELCALESYATVFQLVSTVEGRLRPECDVVDLLRAAFPPGSMTGAPKIAAMQLLSRIEPVRRGPYAGALGYLDARGGADLSVVIRTLLHRPERAWLHVGGGVVADSEPIAEWRESLDKARALLDALAAVRSAGAS